MGKKINRGLAVGAVTALVAGAVWIDHQNILYDPVDVNVEPESSVVILASDIAEKNLREINPLSTPGFYASFYDGRASIVEVGEDRYQLVANLNDPESSAHGMVLENIETGHTILMLKGMDKPLFNEGAGALGFLGDTFGHHGDSADGCISDQVAFFEREYLRLIEDPDVPSIEIIGYSIGAISANYLVGKYNAQTTNIADLGTPEHHYEAVCENGHYPIASEAFNANLDSGVIGLQLTADVLGGALGDIGPEPGQQILLDAESTNWLGAAHVPQVYAASVETSFPEAPEAEIIEVIDRDNQFEPF